MSEEDNTAQQCDEIEAVSAIYGDDFRVIDEYFRQYAISISVGSYTVNLEVKLPHNYPSQSPPYYEFDAHWLRGTRRKQLQDCLNETYLEHVGECILYVWAERVREFLQDLCDKDVELEETLKSLDGTTLSDSNDGEGSNNGGPISSVPCPEITSGDLIVDRKSVFQPHLARVTSVDEVPIVLSRLKENRKIATATHNIYAYRICTPGSVLAQDCEDDGETKAGSRMLHLMAVLDVVNVLVIVTRWYGGCHIGPDRFKHINAATRSILEICGFLGDPQGSKPSNEASKKDKKLSSARKTKS